MNSAASNATPPTTPPIMAPVWFDELPFARLDIMAVVVLASGVDDSDSVVVDALVDGTLTVNSMEDSTNNVVVEFVGYDAGMLVVGFGGSGSCADSVVVGSEEDEGEDEDEDEDNIVVGTDKESVKTGGVVDGEGVLSGVGEGTYTT